MSDKDYELALSFWINERDQAVIEADDNRLDFVNDRITALIKDQDKVLGSFMTIKDVDELWNVPTNFKETVGTKTATKLDYGKPRMDLLSRSALEEISKVLGFGATKYGPNDWKRGMDWSRLYGAALRHLTAHMDGEDLDPESGLSHLAHLGCCVMFLLEYERKGVGQDDRYKKA